MNAESPIFRFIILALVSLCCLGTSLSKDILVAVQVLLTRSPNCTVAMLTEGIDCCQDCTGMGDFNYNSMFSIIFVASIVSMLGVGFLLDKFGNSVIVITTVLAFCGNSLIALGSTISHSPFFLPCMFLGSGTLGLALLSSITCRDRILMTWFLKKEVGLAFGLASCVNRAASFGVFTLTEKIRESIGLQWTLWLMASISLLSLLSSVLVSFVDAWGIRQLNLSESVKKEQESVKVSDVLKFGVDFWLLAGVFGLVGTGQYLFDDNVIEYVFEKGHFTLQIAGIIGGSVRYGGIIAAPLGGLLVDVTDQPQICVMIFNSLLVLAFCLMIFTPIHLGVIVPIIGGMQSMAFTMVLASMSRIVPKENFGIGLSLLIGIMSAVTVVFHTITGAVLGSEKRVALSIKLARWQIVMIITLVLLAISVGWSIFLLIFTKRQKSAVTDEVTYQKLQTESDVDEK